jgi:hypothetical protein
MGLRGCLPEFGENAVMSQGERVPIEDRRRALLRRSNNPSEPRTEEPTVRSAKTWHAPKFTVLEVNATGTAGRNNPELGNPSGDHHS